MSISREDFISCISEKLLAEELSLFLGAGVSSNAGIPTWKALMEPIAKKLRLEIDKQTDYYLLAQYFINNYGKPELKKHINTHTFTFCDQNSALENLLKFNLRTIWTTNFDDLIEHILMKNRIRYQVINNDRGLANLSAQQGTIIYKLNGDRNDLDNIVVASEDWEEYEQTHPIMLTFLRKELVSNTFLFYGYSFQDNLVKTALSRIKKYVGESCNVHYSIQQKQCTKEFEYQIKDLESRYHVKTLLVDSYDEVPEIFEEIIHRVCRKNVFISGRLGDIDPKIETEACELARSISVELLKGGYNICTGMGRKIGYFVAGPAIQYLLEQGYPQIEARIKVRPFDDTMNPQQRKQFRYRLLENNHVVIFMYGHSSRRDSGSPGMWEEYQLAKEMHKVLIPLGATGYESHDIWKDIKKSLTEYPYLETAIDTLATEKNPKKVADILLKILSLVTQ